MAARGGAGGARGTGGGAKCQFCPQRPHIFNATFYTVIFERKAIWRNSRTEKHSSLCDHLLTAVFITWSSSPSYLSVGHLITSR